MDVGRNHLVADINSVAEKLRHRFTEVPDELRAEAARELGGKQEAYINPNRKTALAVWAKKEKKQRQARNKIAKASRKRNRAA